MPKKNWTLEEKKAFGEKMRKAREAKRKPQPVILAPELPPEPTLSPKAEAPDFMSSIVWNYFPGARLKVTDRGINYAVEITIKEGDVRSFVVDKPTASVETENWCKKIKANIEGKSLNPVAGTELMTGVRTQMKKLPPEVGTDKEFFFHAE